MEFEGGNRSILVSNDNHVLDGHHQWLAAREKGEPVKVIRLNAPIEQLVPLAKEMQELIEKNRHVIVCTARVMGVADYRYLTSRGLFADKVISRAEGDRTPDDLLKLRGLKLYCSANRISWRRFCKTAVMFDDNKSVLQTLQANGLTCYDAISTNEALGGAA